MKQKISNSLTGVWDPASLDGHVREFSKVANRAFEDEGFEPQLIQEMVNKFAEEAEKSWAAMDAAEEEQVKAAEASLDAAEAYLDSVMDSGMAQFDRMTDFEDFGEKELDKLSKFSRAAKKMTDNLSAAATIASKHYFEAALVSAAAAFALKSVHNHRFRASR
eukprot:Gb_25381 [translate_table: standard]